MVWYFLCAVTEVLGLALGQEELHPIDDLAGIPDADLAKEEINSCNLVARRHVKSQCLRIRFVGTLSVRRVRYWRHFVVAESQGVGFKLSSSLCETNF